MSWRGTLVLAAVVAAVGFVAYRDVLIENPEADWQTVFEEPPPTVAADTIEHLLDLTPESVIAFQIEYDGRQASSRRTRDGWSDTVKPRAVNDFLEGLSNLAVILTIDEEPSRRDLEGYGLAPAAARIALERSGLPTVTIELGDHNPSGTAIYARVRGRPGVALTGAAALWDLEKALHALSGATPPPED
jgi:hypothetical protein